MKKYWFNSIFFNNRLFCRHRNRISKAVDGVIPTIGNTSGGEYPVLNDTDKNIYDWNNHNQSCIDGYLCSEISSGGDSDSGKSINDNDIDNVVDNDSDEIFKEGIYYLNRTYLHTEDYTDYVDQHSDENLGSVDNDSNICNDEIANSSDSDSLNGSQDFKHLWVVCDQCYISNYKKDLKSNINICEYCGFHLKMNSSDRIEFSVDSGTWEPMDEDLVSVDPIDFDTEDTKGLEISEALKEFKELFEMLDEIAEKEGAEKKEAAEKLKEWEGWEGLKKKDKEEEVEEEEVEEWRKQWNDWEGWGKRQGKVMLEKLFDEPMKVLGDAIAEKKELEKYEKKEWMDKAYEKLLKVFDEIAEEEGAEGRRKELDEWEGKELWALLLKVLIMNLEWWKWVEEIWDLLGLVGERAELEEFQEPFKRLKEFKKLFRQLKGFKMVGDAIAEKKEPKKHEKAEEGEGCGIQKEWMDKACEKLLKVFDEIAEEEEPDEACEKVLKMLNEIAEEEGTENDEEVEEVEEAEEEGTENDEGVEEVEEAEEEGTENDEGVEEVEEAEEEGAENDEEVEEVEEAEERSYLERLDSHQRETGLSEAVQTGIGRINGFAVAMGFMDFQFIGGSMGSVVGEKITRLIEYATENSMPLIMVCASGGARMQEGTLSLMQMAKISSALKDFHLKRKSFYVSILTTPTTGGVTASFGMLGDIIIAEPNAHIAFAGPRIIEQLLNVTVPEGVQEAEYSFEKGLLDSIIPRNPLKGVLSELFQLHGFFSWSFR
uniref:acetyl-CoA carboxylase carboxyltransferase beta n=1 Tax=Annona mucosa TaxID=301699 RepID=UPI0022FD628E|nr:acetyl-CoA carboxylase carboxyltransferase beta [Annona mucosa]WBF97740.1 acetyl-CoA carboxylase carboxyltransferase beta [Annona mucosa]